MAYFSRLSRETKIVRALTFKPDVQSQHRYESKYFHEKDLNNSNFVFFLLNKILCFRSQVKTISKLHLFHWQLRQFRKIVTTCVNKQHLFQACQEKTTF